jgi:formyltetrahydrofolate deformylase
VERVSQQQSSVRAVVSVLGKDQKGVVAQFATYMAERGINIEDIEQRVVRGFFVMDMLVDLSDLSTTLSGLITGLLDLGRKIDMEVKVHLHSERRKRVAILVSKEPHCLEQPHRGPPPRPAPRRDRRRVRQSQDSSRRPGGRACGSSGSRTTISSGTSTGCSTRCGSTAPTSSCSPVHAHPAARSRAGVPPPDHQHPPLSLPYFPGAAPYKQAFESGVRVHGCTAHFVTEQLDEGPVILQDVFHSNWAPTRARREREGLEWKGACEQGAALPRRGASGVEGKVIFKPGISRF